MIATLSPGVLRCRVPRGKAISSCRSSPARSRSTTRRSSSERVSFNTLNRKTGNRLKQNLVDSVSGEPVDTADRVKGYQVAKGQYVMVEDADLEALKIESTKTIEIETFVPAAEIDEIYLDSPYYLAPDDKVAEEAFAVIREAMTQEEDGRHRPRRAEPARAHADAAAARARACWRRRCAIPTRCGRTPNTSTGIGDVKLPAEMLDIAQEIIGRMSGHFEPDKFTDRYEEAVVAMLRAKQAGPDLRRARAGRARQRRQHHGRAEAQPARQRAATAPCAGRARPARSRPKRRPQAQRRASPRRKPRRAKRRADGGRPDCLSPAADPLPRRPHPGPDAPAPRPAGARRAAASSRRGRARSVTTIAFGHSAGRPGARRRPRAAAARLAGDGGADQRERAAPRARPARAAGRGRPQHGPRPRSSGSPGSRPTSSPASCCSTCSSRSTSASPIATSWRRARRRGS